MIEILSPRELDDARASGRFIASVLTTVSQHAKVGTNLLDLDRLAGRLITEAGAESCYVDYAPSFGSGPFGHFICTSVNDAVLHGKPFDYVLRDGDLLTLDFAAKLQGVVTDSALSIIVGTPRPGDQALIDITQDALAAGIAQAVEGNRIGDISHAIQGVLEGAGYRINTQFGGHGVGSTMHQDPHITNAGAPGRGYKLRSGLLLAIEPWIMADTDELVTAADGWTLKSATGARTAHSEHTIAITPEGPEILTAR